MRRSGFQPRFSLETLLVRLVAGSIAGCVEGYMRIENRGFV